MHVSIAEAKARFAALVNRARSGEKIIVTRDGKPVACLGPVPQQEEVEFGDLEGLNMAENLSIPEDIIEDFYRKRS